jgi:hypothetical protein
MVSRHLQKKLSRFYNINVEFRRHHLPLTIMDVILGKHITFTDIIAFFALLVSLFAFSITFLSYRRERSKFNQDLVFQEKIDAYKKLMLLANTIFESFFDIVDDLQDHDNAKKAWTKYMEKESEDYDELVTEFQDAIFESIPILPAKVYQQLIDFGLESTDFINSAFKGNPGLTIKAHEKLEKSLNNLINMVRTDLNVDKLNIDLKKRLK